MTQDTATFKVVNAKKVQNYSASSSHMDGAMLTLRKRTSKIYATLSRRRDQFKISLATTMLCTEICKDDEELQNDARALRALARRQIEKRATANLIKLSELDVVAAESIQAEDIVAGACRNLGVIHMIAGRWAKALAAFQRSLSLFEKAENASGIAQTYNEMATLYIERGFWDKAYDCHTRSLETAQAAGDLTLKGDAILNRAEQFLVMNDYQLAEQHSRIALSLFETAKDFLRKARTYNTLGTIYTRLGKNARAKQFFEKSIKACERGSGEPALIDSYRRYADFFLSSESTKQPMKCLKFSYYYSAVA